MEEQNIFNETEDRREDEQGDSSLRVKLEAFEGPLDLLLHLIKKKEIDIYVNYNVNYNVRIIFRDEEM